MKPSPLAVSINFPAKKTLGLRAKFTKEKSIECSILSKGRQLCGSVVKKILL